tara:strand:+ start:421 stop:558 length:138 start_codon:yes stop_codon:yes gene_type:complete
LSTANIQKKIDLLLTELQILTGASDEELEDFKELLELDNFSNEKD